jgi:hypothetical protein
MFYLGSMRCPARDRGLVALSGGALLCGALGCAEDSILPVDSACGDLQKNGAEECDVLDIGCVECRVAPGFTCTDEKCFPVCGDGTVVTGEECDPPDALGCDSSCRSGQKEEACDMTGYWVVRQTDFSIDKVVSQVQTSSNFYVFQLGQTGDSFQVERAINCGVKVTGSANADLTEASIRGLLWLNPQDTDTPPPRAPRRGTFVASGDACTFAFDRNYMVRGGNPRLLPANFTSKPELATMPPLPSEASPAEPTGANLADATDEDGDGHPGIMYRVSGNASGNRSVVQRDWNEYTTPPGSSIPARAIEFVARSTYDGQENILFVSECPRVGCGLLLAGSNPAPNLPGRATFLYLGKDLAEPRVSRVIAGPLKQDLDQDMQTCANARAALPHDPSKQ